jgi:hypothetical protein
MLAETNNPRNIDVEDDFRANQTAWNEKGSPSLNSGTRNKTFADGRQRADLFSSRNTEGTAG